MQTHAQDCIHIVVCYTMKAKLEQDNYTFGFCFRYISNRLEIANHSENVFITRVVKRNFAKKRRHFLISIFLLENVLLFSNKNDLFFKNMFTLTKTLTSSRSLNGNSIMKCKPKEP